jgi:hypothetical protein
MPFPRPCSTCGVLTRGANKCDKHMAEMMAVVEAKRRLRKLNSGQYSGDYKARAKQVRETAVVCHICKQGFRLGDPWQADHLFPGEPDSPLASAHRSCNARRGSKPLQ